MSKRLFVGVVSVSSLFLGVAFGCGRVPETPEAPPEAAAPGSVDYSAAPNGLVALLKTEAEFNDFIKSAPIAVVKFGAEWCSPCCAFRPDLLKQAGYFADRGVKYAEVDVDELGKMARDLGVESIPDVRVYLDGREYERIVGYEPRVLANLVESVCASAPSAVDSDSASPTATSVSEDADDEKPLEEELWPEE